MLLEVLESVISLETFPFVKRHYTEFTHVGSFTPLLVYCAHMALPTGILLLWMLALHNSHKGMFPHITRKPPRGVHMRQSMGPVTLSLCLTLGLPPQSGLLTRLLPLASEILCTTSFMNWKLIEKCTIYKPQCNFLHPLHCFPRKRIRGQVLIGSIKSLREHT
jgi:hypothetical protein